MKLQKSIKAVIREGEQGGYVAECLGINVATQGETLDEVALNLNEAVELFFDGENSSEYGFVDNPRIILTNE